MLLTWNPLYGTPACGSPIAPSKWNRAEDWAGCVRHKSHADPYPQHWIWTRCSGVGTQTWPTQCNSRARGSARGTPAVTPVQTYDTALHGLSLAKCHRVIHSCLHELYKTNTLRGSYISLSLSVCPHIPFPRVLNWFSLNFCSKTALKLLPKTKQIWPLVYMSFKSKAIKRQSFSA
jgi:hypothetical protein